MVKDKLTELVLKCPHGETLHYADMPMYGSKLLEWIEDCAPFHVEQTECDCTKGDIVMELSR